MKLISTNHKTKLKYETKTLCNHITNLFPMIYER